MNSITILVTLLFGIFFMYCNCKSQPGGWLERNSSDSDITNITTFVVSSYNEGQMIFTFTNYGLLKEQEVKLFQESNIKLSFILQEPYVPKLIKIKITIVSPTVIRL